MDNKKADTKSNPDYRENKFTEEEALVQAENAAVLPASLNEIPKETNPQ